MIGQSQWSYSSFMGVFFSAVSILMTLSFSVTGLCIVYQLVVSPAVLPYVTLSNGATTVRIQTVARLGEDTVVASPLYTDKVHASLAVAHQDGYTLAYDGIRTGMGHAEIAQAFGIGTGSVAYHRLSDTYGADVRPLRDLIGSANIRTMPTDLTTDDVARVIEDRMGTGVTFSSSPATDQSLAAMSGINMSVLNDRSRAFFRLFRRLNLSLQIETTASQDPSSDSLASAVEQERVRAIARSILTSPDHRIYLLVDISRLNALLHTIQNADPTYAVTDTQYRRPLE